MLAKPLGNAVPSVGPRGQELRFEPKWDGFRCILFVTDDAVIVQSRSGEDLAYCFPEIVSAARKGIPTGTVLDGELVIAAEGRLWFEHLGQRIRPRSEAGGWKIAELSNTHPASFVAFDLLATGARDVMTQPYVQRRGLLEQLDLQPPFFRTPMTADPAHAQLWFDTFEGAGLDGIIAKPTDGAYEPGKRTMFKIKHARTADVVVAGWRPHKQPGPDGEPVVGSLLLGLFDEVGRLHHIGVAASFSAKRRIELTAELQAFALDDDAPHPWRPAAQSEQAAAAGPGHSRQPTMQSRWSGGKDLSFRPLRLGLVAEVGYDQMEGTRLRHVAKLLRMRPDRDPSSCTYEQLDSPAAFPVHDVVPGLGDQVPDPSKS
jgi:ATP-dependent DNA ligase